MFSTHWASWRELWPEWGISENRDYTAGGLQRGRTAHFLFGSCSTESFCHNYENPFMFITIVSFLLFQFNGLGALLATYRAATAPARFLLLSSISWRNLVFSASKKASRILLDESHPGHSIFDLFPSGKRFRPPKTKKNRLKKINNGWNGSLVGMIFNPFNF